MAVIEAVPAFRDIFLKVLGLYFAKQAADDSDHYDALKTKRKAIVFAMKQEGVTDEELKNYRRALYDLSH